MERSAFDRINLLRTHNRPTRTLFHVCLTTPSLVKKKSASQTKLNEGLNSQP